LTLIGLGRLRKQNNECLSVYAGPDQFWYLEGLDKNKAGFTDIECIVNFKYIL